MNQNQILTITKELLQEAENGDPNNDDFCREWGAKALDNFVDIAELLLSSYPHNDAS